MPSAPSTHRRLPASAPPRSTKAWFPASVALASIWRRSIRSPARRPAASKPRITSPAASPAVRNTYASCPRPPSSRSSPAPPSSRSSPQPPAIRSSPSAPWMRSLPRIPESRLAPLSPMIESSPSPPIAFSMPEKRTPTPSIAPLPPSSRISHPDRSAAALTVSARRCCRSPRGRARRRRHSRNTRR